jgi:hypothetical protein
MLRTDVGIVPLIKLSRTSLRWISLVSPMAGNYSQESFSYRMRRCGLKISGMVPTMYESKSCNTINVGCVEINEGGIVPYKRVILMSNCIKLGKLWNVSGS